MVEKHLRQTPTNKEVSEKNKKVSAIFNRLVLTITAKYPAGFASTQPKDFCLKASEKYAVEYLKRNTTPEELSSLIFENPPSVIASKSQSVGDETMLRPNVITNIDPSDHDLKVAAKRPILTFPLSMSSFNISLRPS